MFLMNLKTIARWLVMTEFEMLLNILCFTVFSILLCIRLDGYPNIEDALNSTADLKWSHVFMPLFLIDLLQANFITIVFMRQLKESRSKEGIVRLFFSLLLLMTRFMFKVSVYFLISRSTFKIVKVVDRENSHSLSSSDNFQSMNNNNFYYTYNVRTPFRFQLAATPIFLHLSILMFRSCCLKKYQSFN